jgi:host factor-I protein
MSELDVNLPSTRHIQTLIKDKIRVEIKLLTADVLIGRILWQDPNCLFFADADEQKISIYRQAIAFVKPLDLNKLKVV